MGRRRAEMQEEEEEGMKSRGGHETFVKRCRRREKIERSGGDTQQKQEVSEGGRKAWITHKYEKLKVHTWRCSCSMWNLNRSHIRTLNIASGFSLGLKVILHSAARSVLLQITVMLQGVSILGLCARKQNLLAASGNGTPG